MAAAWITFLILRFGVSAKTESQRTSKKDSNSLSTTRIKEIESGLGIIFSSLAAILLISGFVIFSKTQRGWEYGRDTLLTAESLAYLVFTMAVLFGVLATFAFLEGKSTTRSPQETNLKRTADSSTPGLSIPEQIEQLAKLKEQGILSKAEFEEKKKELLSRL